MRKLFIWSLVLCAYYAQAQYPITQAEYFIDTDPGAGQATPITTFTAADSVAFNYSVSLNSLSTGFHVIGLRAKNDSSKWSLTEARPFYIYGSQLPNTAYQILAGEYFIDSDPGVGHGTTLNTFTSADSIAVTQGIALNGISNGFHVLSIRTQNTNGTWALTEARPFYIYGTQLASNAYQISAGEYFVDSDPGVGYGIALNTFTGADSVAVNQGILLNGLSTGFHILSIRAQNTNGTWALTEARPFYVIQNLITNALEITSAEYFVDSDPGVGYGTVIPVGTLADSVAFTDALYNMNYAYGNHIIVVRTKNIMGEWGLNEARDFTIFNCQLTLHDSVQNVTCGGAANGAVFVTAQDGNEPLSYLWNTGALTENLGSLSGGSYVITATDTSGCQVIDTAMVYEPPVLSFNPVVAQLACAESDNGSVALNVAGGRGSYSYTWNNGATTGSISGLTGGQYYVTVTDSAGCKANDEFTINTPAPLGYSFGASVCSDSSYNFYGNPLTNSGTFADTLTGTHGCDSIITLQLTVNTAPTQPVITQSNNTLSCQTGYSYQWYLNGVAIGTDNNVLSINQNGSYTVVASVNGSCGISSEVFIVTNITGLENISTGLFAIFPNPANTVTTVSFNSILSDATVKVINTSGQVVNKKDNVIGNKFTFNVTDLAPAVYFVEVQHNGELWRGKMVVVH